MAELNQLIRFKISFIDIIVLSHSSIVLRETLLNGFQQCHLYTNSILSNPFIKIVFIVHYFYEAMIYTELKALLFVQKYISFMQCIFVFNSSIA